MVSIGTSHSDSGNIISDSGGSIIDTGIFKSNDMDSNITSQSDNTALTGEHSGNSSHQSSSRNYFAGTRYIDDSYGKQFKSWHPITKRGCTYDNSCGRSGFLGKADNCKEIQSYEASGSIAFRTYDGDTGQAQGDQHFGG